jgi:hypothetical protein
MEEGQMKGLKMGKSRACRRSACTRSLNFARNTSLALRSRDANTLSGGVG